MEKIVFDGKWTHEIEWKQSSLNFVTSEDVEAPSYLRTAHYGDFIFVFIDAVNDESLDVGGDNATICIDGQNNKKEIPDNDDFCFTVYLGDMEGFTLQGNSTSTDEASFRKIPNADGFIGISSISDENDRYSQIPHVSYEFKIPIYLVERSNNYGFFVSVYDQSSKKIQTWPKELSESNDTFIPPPSVWGELISPDDTLPEFKWPHLAIIPAFIAIILLSKFKKNVFN